MGSDDSDASSAPSIAPELKPGTITGDQRPTATREEPQLVSDDAGKQSSPCDAEGPLNDSGVTVPKDLEAQETKTDLHRVDTEDFSVYTVPQKRAIVLSGSLIGWFSPMTGSIYYPALNQIAADLGVTSTKINLTVTTYLIFQGLSPMVIAGFSDKAGRRPAYIICFVIYIIANLALALQDNYVALLVLRMLQSAGSSGTIALANGLVGDIITSAERGKYIAYASVGSVLGPALSPVLGGLLSEYLGWHWIFWFLLILSGAAFIPLVLFLPETCRTIVADGSFPPPKSSANLTDRIRFRNRARKGLAVDEVKLEALRQNHKLTFPNPIATLGVFEDPETALILLATGLVMACVYAVFADMSAIFKAAYGFNDIQISLMFLPIGGGSIISVFTTGRLIDWNYRRHATRLGFPVRKNRQTDLSNFPIELARMQIALPLMLLGAATVIIYGWVMQHRVSLAAPIIVLFVMGYALIAGFQSLNVLMVDIYPTRAATITAANNLTRCLLGAAASAAIGPMTDALGSGLAYTILALLFIVAAAGPAASMRYGIAWRRARREKLERRAEARRSRLAAAEEEKARVRESSAAVGPKTVGQE